MSKDNIPWIVQHDGPAPGIGITAPCPFCGENHVHGISEGPKTHRVAHCHEPGSTVGYFLLRPLSTLLGEVEWWKPEAFDGASDLGFTPPEGYDGPGLLELVGADDG